MVAEYKLHLLALDDGNIVCINNAKQATMLTSTVADSARRLLAALMPTDRTFDITPPTRSVELAKKANGPFIGADRYHMSKTMVTMLNSVAALDEPVTASDMIALLSWQRGTVTSKLSMLTTNGYLTRVAPGKYRASPEGNVFLLEHAAN